MLRAGILSVAVAVTAAAPAHAAFDVTEFSLTPSSTAAGANADVTITTAFTPYTNPLATPPEQPRSVVFHLPPGLAGDPFATPKCTQEQFQAMACPPETQVGEVAVEAKTTLAIAANAGGGVFNLVPQGAEPARLGAVIQPETPGAQALLVPTLVQVRPSDGGLDSVIPELPREATVAGLTVPVYTERMTFTLFGKPEGASAPFMRNPTSCRPATTTIDAVPYTEGAAAVTTTSEF